MKLQQHNVLTQPIQHVVDGTGATMVGTTGLLFGVSMASTLQAVQIVAGVLTAMVAVATLVYYVIKIRRMLKDDNAKD